jgi:hypothetical protein
MLPACGAVVLVALMLLEAQAVLTGMQTAVKTCLLTLIPSLYGMMICSSLLTGGRQPKGILGVVLLSQVAGYPVGACMLSKFVRKGTRSRTQASLLAGACFGGGPAFYAGLFSGRPATEAWRVFLAGIAANACLLCVPALYGWYCHRARSTALPAAPCEARAETVSGEDGAAAVGMLQGLCNRLVDAVTSSGVALLKICAMVIACGGMLGLGKGCGLLGLLGQMLSACTGLPTTTAQAILCSIVEISQITALSPDRSVGLPLMGALLSFGGCCVLLQIAAVTGNTLRMGVIVGMRLIAACITGLLLWMLPVGY